LVGAITEYFPSGLFEVRARHPAMLFPLPPAFARFPGGPPLAIASTQLGAQHAMPALGHPMS